MPKQLVLVDHSWCLYRFFFSGVKLSVKIDGEEIQTGQIFGMCRLVHSIKKHYPEASIVFCVDDCGTGDRLEIHEGYKEGRPENPEVWKLDSDIQKALCLCSDVTMAKAIGKESDDVLAQLALANLRTINKQSQFDDVIIYSGDNDLLQMMPFGVKISRQFDKGKFIFLDDNYVLEKYGVTSKHILRYRIIVGDPSDKIPPVVPRLDRKFVRKFVEFWQDHTLEQTFREFNLFENARKLLERYDDLVRNMNLMNLTKYRKPEYAFKVELYKPLDDCDVLTRYDLNSYRQFLYLQQLARTEYAKDFPRQKPE